VRGDERHDEYEQDDACRDEYYANDEHDDEPARPIDRFRATATGTVLAAGLLGLATALEGPKDEEVAIVTEYSGDPPFTDPIVLRLDPDAPEDSIVWIRAVPPSGS
jgi:hypothetical protein